MVEREIYQLLQLELRSAKIVTSDSIRRATASHNMLTLRCRFSQFYLYFDSMRRHLSLEVGAGGWE